MGKFQPGRLRKSGDFKGLTTEPQVGIGNLSAKDWTAVDHGHWRATRGGQLQLVLMRHPPQLSVKTCGEGVGGGGAVGAGGGGIGSLAGGGGGCAQCMR